MINYAYFKRFFKESSIFLVVTTIIFSLINFIITYQNDVRVELNYEYFTTFIYPLFILLFLGPLYVLSYKDSKRKVDVFYSLPISRTTFLITRLIVFLLDSFIIYFVSFFTSVFTSLLGKDATTIYNYSYVIAFFITSFLTFIPLFFFTTYFANKGNSVFDKLVIMAFYSGGFIALFYCLSTGLEDVIDFNIVDVQYYGNPYFYVVSPFEYFSLFFHKLILKNLDQQVAMEKITNYNNAFLPATIIYIILGIVLLFLLLKEEKYDKTERVGQTTSTIMGYKIIMPYVPYIVFGCLPLKNAIGSTVYYILLVCSFALFATTYFIYKRKFIIQKDAIIYSVLFGINIIIVSLCSI